MKKQTAIIKMKDRIKQLKKKKSTMSTSQSRSKYSTTIVELNDFLLWTTKIK